MADCTIQTIDYVRFDVSGLRCRSGKECRFNGRSSLACQSTAGDCCVVGRNHGGLFRGFDRSGRLCAEHVQAGHV